MVLEKIVTVVVLVIGIIMFASNLFYFIFRRYELAKRYNFDLPVKATKSDVSLKMKVMILLGLLMAALAFSALYFDMYILTTVALMLYSFTTIIDMIKYKRPINVFYAITITGLTILYIIYN